VERRLSKAEVAMGSDETQQRGSSLKERTIGFREEVLTENAGGNLAGEDEVIDALGESSRAAENSGVRALTGVAPTTVECQQATEEEANSLRATEPSQQLFHLRRALRLCPEDPRFHVALGNTYASMKREEDASFEYREALRMDSNYAPALQALEALNKKMQDGTQN
jgi:tetratricopeptide (TPR) repeat protein